MNVSREKRHWLQLVLKLGHVFRRSNFHSVLVVLTVGHLFNPLYRTKQVAPWGYEIILSDFLHPFNRQACNHVIVSVMRRPSSCPLSACEILILLQVPAKLLLVTVIFEYIVPFGLEL